MSTGVESDELNQITDDIGRTISYKVVTKTTDSMTGEETTSFGSASDKVVIFFQEQTKYLWDKEGLLKVGDAYIIAKTSYAIKRYDQFTIDGQTYYIEQVIRRYVGSVTMADYATCFLVA